MRFRLPAAVPLMVVSLGVLNGTAGPVLAAPVRLDEAADMVTVTGQPVTETSLQQLPIREVTVFKDGHAFLVHEATLPISAQGQVQLDQLPTPIMGTFWPYARGTNLRLKSVLAARQSVLSRQPALTVQELIRANVGAKVRIKEASETFAGRIVSVPQRMGAEDAPHGSSDGPPVTELGEVVMLETAEGFRVVLLDAIREVTFMDRPNPDVETKTSQHLLTLQVASTGGELPRTAEVGMAYVQRGIRWIPSYRVELDGNGKASMQLQATLINEMVDLEGVTANLVIGVPNFTFKDTIDPIALGRMTTNLSQYFQEGSQTAFALSNAMTTQVARMGEHRNRAPAVESQPPMDLGPELSEGGKREDLFVFSIADVSLKKGQRIVLPVVEFELPYEDVFTVTLDMSPPPELMRHFNNSQQQELARLLHAPKAKHQARLTNKSRYPLTTAPALIMRDGQPLGQAMMTYTPVGARVDLEITAAVDIAVSKSDEEIGRKPDAAQWGGSRFDRIELAGKVELHNFGEQPVTLEVTRQVLGNVDQVGADGQITRLNVREERWHASGGYPHWWHWYSWPAGWFHFNGLGRCSWSVKLEPGKGATLPYEWHYYWQR